MAFPQTRPFVPEAGKRQLYSKVTQMVGVVGIERRRPLRFDPETIQLTLGVEPAARTGRRRHEARDPLRAFEQTPRPLPHNVGAL
jgi:hypothetical protein